MAKNQSSNAMQSAVKKTGADEKKEALTTALSPSFMMAPLPNCFSIWASAVVSASFFSSAPVFLTADCIALLL